MKDLEKIKSEEVAAQVQDANPGNFAIEQEVAQLVGATVPAPTEPSADDARELGAQLLVFLRRALLPIRSALRTAVAAIYAHLDSRCTDYTPAAYDPFRLPAGPYDPMRPFVPRTLPNLLTALTAFSARKISNGGAEDGLPDGISIAHLIEAGSVTELKDDNPGWVWDLECGYYGVNRLRQAFPSLKKLTLNCKEVNVGGNYLFVNDNVIEELYFTAATKIVGNLARGCPNIKSAFVCPTLLTVENSRPWSSCSFTEIDCQNLASGFSGYDYSMIVKNGNKLERVVLPKVPFYHGNNSIHSSAFGGCPNLKYIDMSGCTSVKASNNSSNSTLEGFLGDCYNVETLRLGTLTQAVNLFVSVNQTTKLIDLEIGAGTAINLDFTYWNPTNVLSDADKTATFLQNFREHIALRLTANGTGKTLTLSQEVRNAIHAAESTYGIENIIVTQKGWTISPAPN